MKNMLLGVALGIGASGVIVALVLALSGGDDETTVVAPAATPPAAAAPATQDSSGIDAAPGGVNSSASVESLARAYCEVERRDPDDFQREFGGSMETCIEREIQAAGRECEIDLANDRGDYERQFGGAGDAALERCLRYELQSF